MSSNFNKIFLPIAFTILILGLGLYFYYNNKNKNQNTPSPQIKADAGGIPISGTQSGGSENASTMSNASEYSIKILDIRGPINKQIEDLISKSKYTTLFDNGTMIKQAEDIKNKINEGINTLNGLSLSSDLKKINEGQIGSLNLLNEAMDAYIAMKNATDQTEQQKQSELMSYKIDESNKLIQAVSGTGSSSQQQNNSQSGSSQGNIIQ